MADRFVRPLNRSEEMKIVEALFRMGNNGQMMRRRLRRHPHFDAAKEEDNAAEVVEEDLIDQSTASRLTDILARFLDVDAAVLRRFLPNENRTDELVAAAGREWAAIYRRVAAESRRNFTDTEKRSLTFTLLNEEESTTTISRARRLAGDQLVEEIEEGPLEHSNTKFLRHVELIRYKFLVLLFRNRYLRSMNNFSVMSNIQKLI